MIVTKVCMTGKYESDAGSIGWSDMMDHAAAMPELADRRAALVAEARKRLELPLVRRVYRYDDVGKHRTWLDGRAKALEPAIREIFDRDGTCPKHVCLVLTTVEAANICSISMSANREAKTGCTELPINERDGQKLREIQ